MNERRESLPPMPEIALDTREKLLSMKRLIPSTQKKPTFVEGVLPLKKSGDTTFVAWYDDHFPNNRYFEAKLSALREAPPDYLILGGDNLDMTPFNHWEKAVPRRVKELPDPKDYYDRANKEFYRPLREAVGKRTIIIQLYGNHENWANRAVDMIPEGRGYFEPEFNIEDGTVDAWVAWKGLVALGEMSFVHGDLLKGTSKYHAERMVSQLHRSVMYGHHHTQQLWTWPVYGDERPKQAIGVPSCTDPDPDYNQHAPNNHVSGFASGLIRPDGRAFWQVNQIKGGEFIYHGRLFKARQSERRYVQ